MIVLYFSQKDITYLIEIKEENSSNIFLITVKKPCIFKFECLSNILLRSLYCIDSWGLHFVLMPIPETD